MIHGIGTDVVAVARVRRLVDDDGQRFLARWFTDNEIAYCMAKAHPARHLAARLAAKESVVKALRLDGAHGVPWHDIEVVLDSVGAPGIQLHGSLADAAPPDGHWHVALSHEDDQATAVAVLELDRRS